jgi:hypothetical protein
VELRGESPSCTINYNRIHKVYSLPVNQQFSLFEIIAHCCYKIAGTNMYFSRGIVEIKKGNKYSIVLKVLERGKRY